MSVRDFLDGDHLERADILLKCGDSLFSKVIRFATKSPFSHSAIIFLIPKRDFGFTQTFLIDATPNGVSVGELASVVSAFQMKQGVGTAILRFEQPWFDEDTQKRVSGHMLSYVRSRYDWRSIAGLACALTRAIAFGPERYATLMGQALRRSHRKGMRVPGSFICSGLVLYGFLRAVFDMSREAKSAPPEGSEVSVIFNPNLTDTSPTKLLKASSEEHAALLATTPDEISRSERLTWKFFITRGLVYEVSSRDEALQILQRNGTHRKEM